MSSPTVNHAETAPARRVDYSAIPQEWIEQYFTYRYALVYNYSPATTVWNFIRDNVDSWGPDGKLDQERRFYCQELKVTDNLRREEEQETISERAPALVVEAYNQGLNPVTALQAAQEQSRRITAYLERKLPALMEAAGLVRPEWWDRTADGQVHYRDHQTQHREMRAYAEARTQLLLAWLDIFIQLPAEQQSLLPEVWVPVRRAR
jgi:hypothetical protein